MIAINKQRCLSSRYHYFNLLPNRGVLLNTNLTLWVHYRDRRKVRKSSGSLQQEESEKQIKVWDWGKRTIHTMLGGVSGLNCGLIVGTPECP